MKINNKTTFNATDMMENYDLEYSQELVDYIEHGGYINDAVNDIADKNTSIYYSDILEFISNHPDSLAEVIDEGLYDPRFSYSIYEHGRAAEYMLIERSIYDELDAGLEYAALYYIKVKYNNILFDELYEGIKDICIDSYRLDKFNEITDYIDEFYVDIFTDNNTA